MNNLRDYVAAKQEVVKLQEESKEFRTAFMPQQQEEAGAEYSDPAEKREDEEYNIGEGGLDEFMTALKQKPQQPAAGPYATAAVRIAVAVTTPVAAPTQPISAEDRTVENDNEIMGFAQGAAQEIKAPGRKVDDFEQLFGDAPVEHRATPKKSGGGNAYNQFAAYYTAYQQQPAAGAQASYQQQPKASGTPEFWQ